MIRTSLLCVEHRVGCQLNIDLSHHIWIQRSCDQQQARGDQQQDGRIHSNSKDTFTALKLEMAPSEEKSLKACTEMILKRLKATKSPAFLVDIDAVRFGVPGLIMELAERFQASLAAEILFLRKQLAVYQEREIKPRRFDDAARSIDAVLV